MNEKLGQELFNEENKLKLRQRHENNHQQQYNPEASIGQDYSNTGRVARITIESDSKQKCLITGKVIEGDTSLDQRKSHGKYLIQNSRIDRLEQIEKLLFFYTKMNKTKEEISEMEKLEKEIVSNQCSEKDESCIIKQDDESTRGKEHQEKISKDTQPQQLHQSNNNQQQTLFKIQSSSNSKQNEHSKDNNDRQSLVIKLVKIAQQHNDSKEFSDSCESNLKETPNKIGINSNDKSSMDIKLDKNVVVPSQKSNALEASEKSKQQNDDDRKQSQELPDYIDEKINNNTIIRANLQSEQISNTINQVERDLLELAEPVKEAPDRHSPNVATVNSNSDQLDQEVDENEEQDQEEYNDNDANADRDGDGDVDGDMAIRQENADNQDSPAGPLGRNRRVRQKNRYFTDFHCMKLAKGTRSKDDCDTNSTALTSTRTLSRRSTTDSRRGGTSSGVGQGAIGDDMGGSALDEETAPLGYELKRCRKCREKTPHDQLNGCQACVYKKIVEKHKGGAVGQKKSSSSTPKRKYKPRQKKSTPKQTPDASQSVKKPKTTSTEGSPKDEVPSGLKRKAKDQLGRTPKSKTGVASKNTSDDEQSTSGRKESDENPLTNLHPVTSPDTNDASRPVSSSSSNSSSGPDSSRSSSPSQDNYPSTSNSPGDRSNKVPSVPQSSVSDQDRPELTSVKQEEPCNEKEDPVEDPKRQNENNISRNEKKRDQTTTAITESNNDLGKNDNNNRDRLIKSEIQDQARDDPNLINIDSWTPEEVARYVHSKGFIDEAELFKSQLIDGISLMLMQRNDFTTGLKMKLGPALKLYDQVCKLKSSYLR